MARTTALPLAVVLLLGAWWSVAALAQTAPAPVPSVATATGNVVLIRFDRKVRGTPPAEAFLVRVNGQVARVTGATVNGKSVRVLLSAAGYGDDLIAVRYLPVRSPGALGLRGEGGARVSGFRLETANRGPGGCTDPLGVVVPATAGEGPTDTAFFAPSLGRLGVAYVPVDFPDSRDGLPSFTPNPSAGALPVQLAPIVSELSYGRLKLEALPAIGVGRMSRETGAYGLGVTPSWPEAKPFLEEALAIASVNADFSQTDIVVVEINGRRGTPVPSGRSGFESAFPVVGPVGQGVIVDGREIRAVVFVRGRLSAEGILPSLLRLLGLPKLTDRQDQLGAWDTMTGGAEPGRASLFGWHRRKLGWLDPTQVRCVRSGSTELTLTPVGRSGGLKLIVAPIGPTAAVLVELRRREGLDQKICREGLLVTRVDTAVPIHDPLVTSPVRVVINRPLPPIPVLPGSEAFACSAGLLYAQVLDAAVPAVSSDGINVRLVSETPDGAAVVRVER